MQRLARFGIAVAWVLTCGCAATSPTRFEGASGRIAWEVVHERRRLAGIGESRQPRELHPIPPISGQDRGGRGGLGRRLVSAQHGHRPARAETEDKRLASAETNPPTR